MPVPYGRMTKRQLHQFLTKRIKKTLKPDEIRADELSLKMFGLVPQDFDLKKSTIDLLDGASRGFLRLRREEVVPAIGLFGGKCVNDDAGA